MGKTTDCMEAIQKQNLRSTDYSKGIPTVVICVVRVLQKLTVEIFFDELIT